MIRRTKPGMPVLHIRLNLAMTIESVSGDAVWCTWDEDGQTRRGVFSKEELERIR